MINNLERVIATLEKWTRRVPFILHEVGGHPLNNDNSVFDELFRIDQVIQLGCKHCLQEIYAVADNYSIAFIACCLRD